MALGADDQPVGATAGGPITPGQGYEFEIEAAPGQTLSMAWMFGQSNDLFYSNDRPIALFDAAGKPVQGDMTAQLALWDAGTEVNEEPGLGPNQGPRQKTPEAGVAEHQVGGPRARRVPLSADGGRAAGDDHPGGGRDEQQVTSR